MPNVLVADDEQLVRWSLAERLQADGLRVVEAGTGQQAIEKIRQEAIDLVLLDYKLPDTDGVTVLRQIKTYDPDIVVILLTAYATVDTAVEAMKTGAYHVANKPFNLEAVSARWCRHCRPSCLGCSKRRRSSASARNMTSTSTSGSSPPPTATSRSRSEAVTSVPTCKPPAV